MGEAKHNRLRKNPKWAEYFEARAGGALTCAAVPRPTAPPSGIPQMPRPQAVFPGGLNTGSTQCDSDAPLMRDGELANTPGVDDSYEYM